MLVPVSVALAKAQRALRLAGVPTRNADLQVDLLIEADLRGRASHGLMRLPRIIERIRNGVADPRTQGAHSWRGSFLEVDGLNGLGPVVAWAALESLIAVSRKEGISVAAIRNNNHLGMLGWYAERVAKLGLVLIAASTSEALVHPWNGREAMLGTNPLAIGVPTTDEPFVLDMATSLVSMGQIHDHADRGIDIPAHWALDAGGNPTTDAKAARHGSIAPFGEAKGYAMGLALEVLVTSLAASAIGKDVVGTLDSDRACNKGDIFIVIDAQARPGVAARITAYLHSVRSSGDGHRAVNVPGDRARKARNEAFQRGLSISDDAWGRIENLALGPAESATEEFT